MNSILNLRSKSKKVNSHCYSRLFRLPFYVGVLARRLSGNFFLNWTDWRGKLNWGDYILGLPLWLVLRASYVRWREEIPLNVKKDTKQELFLQISFTITEEGIMSALLTLLTHEYKSIFLLSWVPRRIFSSIDSDKDVGTTVNCTMDIGEETQRAISSLLAKDHVIT